MNNILDCSHCDVIDQAGDGCRHMPLVPACRVMTTIIDDSDVNIVRRAALVLILNDNDDAIDMT